MKVWDVNIETDFKGLEINNPTEKFANIVTEQFRNKLGVIVTHEIVDNTVNIFIETKGEKKRNIPYKIVNGKIIVPKEFQKYLSDDGRSLTNINEETDYNKTINEIDLNIFK